ncbi:MAG TPA: phosphatase PAP2 family protein [Gaiellaceae bacterium]
MSRANAATAAALAGAFAALAGLIAAGELTSIDQWAVDHVMPGAVFGGKPTFADAVIPLRGVRWHGAVHILSTLVTLPASFTPATLIVAAACLRLRGRPAVALAAAYVAGNVVEVLVKGTLTRPPLHAGTMHLAGFDASYPSGHTIRTVFVATAIAWAWPRLAPWAATWAVASVVLLVLGGQHVPSDVAGGLAIAAALVLTTSSWTRERSTGRRPSPACPPSARAR